MHLESLAVETGDPAMPYLARITIGTKRKRDIMHEWPTESLSAAQAQADDWLHEWSYRLGLASEQIAADRHARATRLRTYLNAPEMPGKRPPELPTEPARSQSTVREPREKRTPQVLKRHPNRATVVRAVKCARAAGIVPAGIKVWPDGSVAVFDATAITVDGVRSLDPLADDLEFD